MLTFEPIGFILILLYLMILFFRNRSKPISVHLILQHTLFYIYILTIIRFTLFPIPIDPHSMKEMTTSNDMNLFLLVPLGFIVPMIWKPMKQFSNIVVLGFISSFVIEMAQIGIALLVGFTFKHFDFYVLSLNTLGVMIGFLLFSYFPRRFIQSFTFFIRTFLCQPYQKEYDSMENN